MPRIGYARVSTLDQDHATQEARLKAAGCEIIRAEKASGKGREGRDELASILEFIRAGDELVVVKLDRLGRSTRDVLNLVHELEAKGGRAHGAGACLLDQGSHRLDPPHGAWHGSRDGAPLHSRAATGRH